MQEAGTGEPTIYDGQHTSEPHTVLKAGQDIGAIVTPIWEIADERRLQHDRRTDIALKGRKSESRKGASESSPRMPDKPLLIRSMSDFRENHFQSGNQWRKETLRRSE